MKALDKQVGESDYKGFVIQPVEFSSKNSLSFLQGSIVKRICRYDRSGKGLEDLQKIIHEVELIIELEGWEEEKHWERKPVTIGDFTDTPKVHACQCGHIPYTNVGNGQYWIECPKCHTTGLKTDTQHGAQKNWNEGRIIHDAGIQNISTEQGVS